MDFTRRFAEGVFQFALFRRGGIFSVGDVEYSIGRASGGGAVRRVAGEGGAGRGAGVADGGWDGAVEDTALDDELLFAGQAVPVEL